MDSIVTEKTVFLMKSLRPLALSCVVSVSLGVVGGAEQIPTVAPSGLPCEAVGDIRFICNLISPEDLAVVPRSEWVTASGNRAGGRPDLVRLP